MKKQLDDRVLTYHLLCVLRPAPAQKADALHKLGPSTREALSHQWHGTTWVPLGVSCRSQVWFRPCGCMLRLDQSAWAHEIRVD